MSTGRRLAKRSIIGTRVCAPGPDGLWYSGVIQDVKTPPSRAATSENNNCINLTPDTKYTVRFDFKTTTTTATTTSAMQQQGTMSPPSSPMTAAASPSPTSSSLSASPSSSSSLPTAAAAAASIGGGAIMAGRNGNQTNGVIMDARQHRANSLQHLSPAQSLRRSVMMKEFRETDLIGPGFRSMIGVQLHPSQRVFLTYNGRETSGDVVTHDLTKDEVVVRITAIGSEEPIELKKRLEEVRLLESRRSARLADQDRDTDFARLADMGGDRRRTSSHNIDVPLTPQHNSRKRRPSYTQERDSYLTQCRDDDEIKLCNAALVLMHLSGSPLSPKDNVNTILGSSPGSSSAWSSGSSSPPLSDDGKIFANHMLDSARIRTTSLSTSDEGIVMDYNDDAPRKRRVSEGHSSVPRRVPKPVNKRIFKCTWRGCGFTEKTAANIERHVRDAHIGQKKARRSVEDDGSFSESDHEEEFYYTEIEDEDDEGKAPSPPSPPTLSHRDMARPPHEDPEYQRQIVGNFKQGLAQSNLVNSKYINISNNGANNNQQYNTSHTISIPSSPLAHHNYTWPSPVPAQQHHHNHHLQQPTQQQQNSPVSPMKHPRWSPRPSPSAAAAPYPSPTYIHHHHHNYSSSSSSSSSSSAGSPNSNSGHIIHQMQHQTLAVNQQQQQQQITHQQQQQQYHQHHHQLMQHSIPSSTTVTISPNIHHTGNHQQQQPQQQHLQHHQQHHQQQQQQQQQHHHNHHNHHRMQTPSPASITATVTPTHRLQSPNIQNTKTKGTPNSPNRRTRGENKKCRKVYGMERREQWCTQCKWKKACSRFGD